MLPEVRRAHYQSFLLRLWLADDSSPWHASLQSTANGETRTFADLESLLAFLLKETDKTEDRPEEAISQPL